MANQQVFLEHPEEELTQPEYRALSALAVIAFLLGVASALVLISPLLLVVPAMAVVTAIAALRQISGNPDLAGRRVALAGVALAVLFAAWEPSYVVLRNRKLNQEAQVFSSAWLNLIAEGRYYEAHQWSEPYFSRRTTSKGLKEAYLKDGKGLRIYEEYFSNSPFDIHASTTPELSFEYLGNDNIQISNDDSALITQRFRISFQADGVPQSKVILVTARRSVLKNSILWQLYSFKTSS